MKIGLALSGGIARGMAHIGVLKYLEECRLAISSLAGTSAGSIIAGLYCAGVPLAVIEQNVLTFSWKKLFKLTLPHIGLVDSALLEKLVESFIGSVHFSQLKIPLVINAVDLVKGEEVVLESGPVALAIRASCAIPGIFTPVKVKDQLLVDGGVLNNIPARLLKERGMDTVIAVDVNPQKAQVEAPQNIVEVLFQAYAIIQQNQRQTCHNFADLVIQPDLDDISPWDVSKGALLIERGYEACRLALSRQEMGIRKNRGGLFSRIFHS